jgi:molecular chaperone HscB
LSAVNPYKLFALPLEYQLDAAEVEAVYFVKLRQCHPDRNARANAETQASCETETAVVNEAYAVLQNPVQRGQALLAALGQESALPQVAPETLMAVLEWQERRQQDSAAAMNVYQQTRNSLEARILIAFKERDYKETARLLAMLWYWMRADVHGSMHPAL